MAPPEPLVAESRQITDDDHVALRSDGLYEVEDAQHNWYPARLLEEARHRKGHTVWKVLLDDGWGTVFKQVPRFDLRKTRPSVQTAKPLKTMHAWGVWTPFSPYAEPQLVCKAVYYGSGGAGHGSVVLVDEENVYEMDSHGSRPGYILFCEF